MVNQSSAIQVGLLPQRRQSLPAAVQDWAAMNLDRRASYSGIRPSRKQQIPKNGIAEYDGSSQGGHPVTAGLLPRLLLMARNLLQGHLCTGRGEYRGAFSQNPFSSRFASK